MGDAIRRVQRTAPAVLEHVFEIGEEPTDAVGDVTVTITDAAGTEVTAGTADHGGTGRYTFPLDGQADLGQLTVAWAATLAGADVVQTDVVEIVGGFFFTLREARGSDQQLTDTRKYDTAALEQARLEVETECEAICDRAFVPRYARLVTDGTGENDLVLPHPGLDRTMAHVRRIRSVSMAPRADRPFTDFTSAELAALEVAGDGTLRRLDGRPFTRGFGNVIVELEYGLDAPPPDLVRAALVALRARLHIPHSSIPDRASSFTSAEGGTYRLDMPGAYKLGIPMVDAVYGRYSRRSGAGTGTTGKVVPASRPMDFDPQYSSLFHGGRR